MPLRMKRTASILRGGLLICLLGILVSACRPELDFKFPGSGKAAFSGSGDTYTLLFDSEAGTATLEMSASGNWTAEFVNGRAYWCSLSAMEGKRGVATLTINVQANGEYDERSASIVFTCKDLKRTIIVTQKQRDALLLSSGRVEMRADGGSFTVEVMSNVDFTSTIESDGNGWIHPLSTKGLEKSNLTFKVDPNESLDRRSGTLTFVSAAGKETVSVYQRGETPTIVISEENIGLSAEEGVFKVEVASNIDAALLIPEECGWLREIKTKTISTNTFQFAYDRNHAREMRSCRLIFQNESYKKSDTVYVDQAKAAILLENQDFYLPSTGDRISVLAAAAVSSLDQLRFECEWLVPDGVERYADSCRFFFRVGENPQRTQRSASVAVSRPDFDQPDVFRVTQFSLYPSFSYTVKGQEVAAPELTETETPYLVFWGDGSQEYFVKGLTHHYESAGPHTIRVEGQAFPLFELPKPADGMLYDFSKLNL